MTTRWNRRKFVQAAAGTTGALTAYSMTGFRAFGQDAQPTSPPVDLGEGDTEISVWVQDYGPSIENYSTAAQAYIDKGNNIRVTVQPIPYDEMLPKLLPAIATGNEGDIMMGYTNFYVATDITQLFLRLDEAMPDIRGMFVPESLEALDMPEGAAYYLPTGAGLNGAAVTLDKAAWDEAGIDYNAISTWEELVEAARELTVFDGSGNMTRAGLSNPSNIWNMQGWVWQLGGSFYDQESGEWSFATPEGEAALELHYNLYHGDSPVSSFDLIAADAAGYDPAEDMVQGRLAAHMAGAYSVSNAENLYPEFDSEGIPTPPLADAVENVINPAHFGVITLSRRLEDDDTKREHCLGILEEYFNVDDQIARLETYSGSVLDQRVYDDPRISDYRYGEFSKTITEATFSRARFNQDHVANFGPAETEFQRGVRGEISIQEALQNADNYLNEQERQARERIDQ